MAEKEKIILNPYLTFTGNCRETMTFYQEYFDGELELNVFEGAPMEVPPEWKDKILHATLKFGDAVIMASDSMPWQEVINGNSVSLSSSTPNNYLAQSIFDHLSRDGKITMPFEKTFWGVRFGMLTDKFGVRWMINCEMR